MQRKSAVGYKVVRINFENGKPLARYNFLTGLLINSGKAHFTQLAGIAVAKDGSLWVSDDTNGIIYRVSYKR
jgi:glucose/arabinose dehydrogenase